MNKDKIKDLVENKAELISLKKAEIKTVKGGLNAVIPNKSTTTKGVFKNNDKSLERTIIGNTYMWFDSHEDVHAKNVFSKSIKERKNNIFHLHDHEFKITAKVGDPLDIYESEIKWKDLNVDKEGSTDALFMDTEIFKEYNAQIFNEYKKNKINQHSVGMQYVKIDLAVNDESFDDEYKVWSENIDQIGNKEKAEKKGYFWFVREAKLIEVSAVLLGSNELTPTMAQDKQADSESLETKEAEKSLRQEQTMNFLTNIKF